MKGKEKYLLSVYIFYNQSDWHYLLEKLSSSIIKDVRYNLDDFRIYLSCNRGDHINIVFQLDKNNMYGVSFLEKSIRRYLHEKPSLDKKLDMPPVTKLFMDYHNNSFWIEEQDAMGYLSDSLKDIKHELSKCILDALRDDEVDTGSLLSLIIYLQVGFINSFFTEIEVANRLLIATLSKIFIKESDVVQLSEENRMARETVCFASSLEVPREIIVEIIFSIWNQNEFSEDIRWMKTWNKACRAFAKDKDFQRSYLEIVSIINKHLGLTVSNEAVAEPLILIVDGFNSLVTNKVQK
jgi:hypothetical protein